MALEVREARLRSAILIILQTFLTLRVREKGVNRGEVVEAFLRSQGGKPGMPWCVAFAAWVYETACKLYGERCVVDAQLSCSELYAEAQKAKRIIPAAEARTGDFFLIRGGPTGWQHIGVISQPVDAEGYLTTIEGNTNEAGSAEGDGIHKRRRKIGLGVAISIKPEKQ